VTTSTIEPVAAERSRPRRRLRARDLRWVGLCFVVALVVRVAFVIAVERPSFAYNDAFFYHAFGDALADGRGYVGVFGAPTARWPPGWGFVLSLVYRVTGAKPLAGELTNAVFGALTVPLLFVVARRAFGRAEAAVAAAWLAVLPGPILWADLLFSETFYTFVLVAFFALLAVLPTRWWAIALLGVAVGLAALVRGEGLFLALPALAYWYRQVPARTWVLRAAVLGAAIVVTLVPWTLRNLARLDSVTPISSNVGATMWAGHNPTAFGGATYYPAEGRCGLAAMNEADSSDCLQDEAIDYMVHHPVRELELIPLKLIHLNRGDGEVLDLVNEAQPGEEPALDHAQEVRLGVLANAGYYALLALAVASVTLLRRRLWANPLSRAVLVTVITALFLYGFLYFGSYRYRLPLEPLMILLAAPLVTGVWRQRRAIRC